MLHRPEGHFHQWHADHRPQNVASDQSRNLATPVALLPWDTLGGRHSSTGAFSSRKMDSKRSWNQPQLCLVVLTTHFKEHSLQFWSLQPKKPLLCSVSQTATACSKTFSFQITHGKSDKLTNGHQDVRRQIQILALMIPSNQHSQAGKAFFF